MEAEREKSLDLLESGRNLSDVKRHPEDLKEPLLCSYRGEINPSLHGENTRIASLDVFRGFSILAMILVDYAGGIWAPINHSPWNGLMFADFVMPAFLFIAGVSTTLTLKRVPRKRVAIQKVVYRVLKLFFLGMILQGGYFHGVGNLNYGVNVKEMRIMGILQRIAIAYLVVAICQIMRKNTSSLEWIEGFIALLKTYFVQWLVAFILTAVYLGLLYGLYVPNWEYEAVVPNILRNTSDSVISTFTVQCNIRGDLSPGCNAVGYVDRLILGLPHLYQHPTYRRTKDCSVDSPYNGDLPLNAPTWCLAAFDPEGILSSIMPIVTCFIGGYHGHILLHAKGHNRKLQHFVTNGLILVLLGSILAATGMPLNKSLYSLSYTCVTAGASALTFCFFYLLVDVYGWLHLTYILKWIGMHSILLYILFASNVLPVVVQGFYWGSSSNNLVTLILHALGL